MNFANADEYDIGLDLGTGSVGWAVVDNQGELLHIKGKPTWGSRLFPSANAAANTRAARGQRRRYARRRQRIDRLQLFFLEEMAKVDPEFFVRLRQSRLHQEDRNPAYETNYAWPLFNGSDFTEHDYYTAYPTIWHLRKELMEKDEKADIRLIYLALHNIVKYRGNFLREDNPSLRAVNANARDAAQGLADALCAYLEDAAGDQDASSCSPDVATIQECLEKQGIKRAERKEQLAKALGCDDKKLAANIAKACTGYQVEFAALFIGLSEQEGTELKLSDDEKVETFESLCPDDAAALFEAMKAAYSASVLAGVLRGEKSPSAAMVKSYKQHKADLKVIKALVREYLGLEEYQKFFRGSKDAQGRYDVNKIKTGTYTSYILGEKLCNKNGTSHEELVKELRKLLEKSNELQADERFLAIRDRLYADDDEFLAKQKTRSNGTIPYQLHLEEMERIIEKQGRYYPFLLEHAEEMKKLVSSRIPYYVGPLNTGHDPQAPYKANTVDDSRKFAWSVRRPGMEGVKAYPWNVDEVIDTDETAERFIRRMTGTCTYLYGEPVLPRYSLLYEEFCVLNELNSARFAIGDLEAHRFDYAYREEILEEVFKGGRSAGVSHRRLASWLERTKNIENAKISATQGESSFESKLKSYHDFCNILGVSRLEDPDCPLSIEQIEQLILWCTVFEDSSIRKRKIEQAYGDLLSDAQIKRIVKLRYTGWGRLSRKFLTEVRIDTPVGRMSIMDVLRDGDPVTGHHRRAMNLMETLRDKDLQFQEHIDEINTEHLKREGTMLSVEDLPGSPALRRSVNQAMRILDELVSIAGKAPRRICIEVTRDDDLTKKGSRTKTREKKLKEALRQLKADTGAYDPELMRELSKHKSDLDNEKLMLYFSQGGKSLYSGKPLDINRLSEYQVDHILPQSYIKDDSLDNKALVRAEENQRKLDTLLLDTELIRKRYPYWKELERAGLISSKKFGLLTCTSISDSRLTGFINRQLVETSQIVKFVRQMCEQRYPDTEIVSLRASLTSNLRKKCKFVKCRELNHYHHAHDAFLACRMAQFISYRYPKWQDGFDLAMVRKYVARLHRPNKQGRRIPGEAGFIVDSFVRNGFDKETGELFHDAWDADRALGRIRVILGYKECFVTRMVEEQTGAFWEDTIYSPRDISNGKNLSVPLKRTGAEGYLDPRKYGGTNTEFKAYFFAFTATDTKGRAKYFFEGVPVRIARMVKNHPKALLAYACEIAAEKKCHDVKVLRAKVPLRQKLEIDGDSFYLGGRTRSSNVVRVGCEYAAHDCDKIIFDVLGGDGKVAGARESAELFGSLDAFLRQHCARLSDKLRLPERSEAFAELDLQGQRRVLGALLRAINGDAQNSDLTLIGGKKSEGFMLTNIASKLPSITWIDQSVTGIYEKRTTFEELMRGV